MIEEGKEKQMIEGYSNHLVMILSQSKGMEVRIVRCWGWWWVRGMESMVGKRGKQYWGRNRGEGADN